MAGRAQVVLPCQLDGFNLLEDGLTRLCISTSTSDDTLIWAGRLVLIRLRCTCAWWMASRRNSGHLVARICTVSRIARSTYVEEELAVDGSAARGVRQVVGDLRDGKRLSVEVCCLELVESRRLGAGDLPVLQSLVELLLPGGLTPFSPRTCCSRKVLVLSR